MSLDQRSMNMKWSTMTLPAILLEPTAELTTYGTKLGWIQGVLIPCLLNIWGVMLFLRIAWIVSQAGIGYTILIICISATVCVVTTLSLSAICTNGTLKGGGVYFIVSRSLGAELGASVGIIFAFANAVAASMNTIGFCESFNELLKSLNLKIIDNSTNDIRIVGAVALFVMCFICAIGMDWETKTQNFLIICIVSAIISYIIGVFVGPQSDNDRAQGFMGFSFELGRANWGPDFRYSEGKYHNFFSVFAVYFPAVTGVQAGANICGDLRDPATAIPKGTLLALAISATSYFTMSLLSGMGALRDASGNTTDIYNADISACKPDCPYGLHNNYQIMHLMALWGPMVYVGCWAATLSTALTNLLAVPRLIQALGVDRIYPGLIFFSKPYGKHGEPYRGYVLVYIVSLLFLLIADLNAIAPLITNFYLASYALINFCTFHGAFFKPSNWRPTFQYYNLWLSLAGFFVCIVIMMIISWMMALFTTLLFLLLYLLVMYRKPEVSWSGSSGEAQNYQAAISSIVQLSQQPATPQSFSPQLLVMSGSVPSRRWLIDMAKLIITSVGSFMIVTEISPKNLDMVQRKKKIEQANKWLYRHKARAFYVLKENSKTDEQAIIALLQCVGLGKLSPNILLIGYMYNWYQKPCKSVVAYYRWCQLAFEYGLAVSIFRVSNFYLTKPALGVEIKNILAEDSNMDVETLRQMELMDISRRGSPKSVRISPSDQSTASPVIEDISSPDFTSAESTVSPYSLMFPERSTLDAWWLYDDGGLNILLPYLITRRGNKGKMQLRIFVLPKFGVRNAETHASVAKLLSRYRITYSCLTIVEGAKQEPSEASWKTFETLIEKHRTPTDRDACLVSEADFVRLRYKTNRLLRLKEMLMEHSTNADLIVMTLPHPREGQVPAALYLAWLDVISSNLPSMLFVRGNNAVVE